MRRVIFILLGLSLAGNAWLFARAHSRTTPLDPAIQQRKSAAAPSSAVSAVAIAALESGDAATLRDALRAAGADDWTVRAVVEGTLRRRHRESLGALRIERTRTAWWRAGRSVQKSDTALTRERVDDPLEKALGSDPLDLVDAESRYAFLPMEKRRLLAQIDLDYADLFSRSPARVLNTHLQPEVDEQRLLAEERKKDVMAALTPDEQMEYELRFSGMSGMLSRRAGTMGATEAEFRALKPVIDVFEEKSRAIPRDADFTRAYAELQRATAQELVMRVGYDRTLAYIWSGNDSDFDALRRASETARLPVETPARVMALAADVAAEARRVHEDSTRSIDAKRAALVVLQQSAQVRLGSVLPSSAQQELPADGLKWITALAEGRYLEPMPSLLSSGGWGIFSITTPPPPEGSARSSFMPVPAKNQADAR